MTAKLKEKDAAIASLEKYFELKLLNEQEEGTKQLRKVKEEQRVLMNQLNSANSTVTGLGHELSNEKRIIEELKGQIDRLEKNLSKAGGDKRSLEQELKEKLDSIEVLQDGVNLLSLEFKDKEDNVRDLSSLLAEKELELKNLNPTFKQTKDELAKAQTEINVMKDELLKHQKELELKSSMVEQLNTTVSSLLVERDEADSKYSAIMVNYNDLKSSSEKQAAMDANLLQGREDELYKVKEKLELALTEGSGKQVVIVDLTSEMGDLRTMLDTELGNVKNLKHELQIAQEACGKSRNEASVMARQLEQSRKMCSKLESEASEVQTEFSDAIKAMAKSLEKEKASGELLAGELMAVKKQLKKTEEELQNASLELESITKNRNSIQKELVDVYDKAEVAANELTEERKIFSSLNMELENLEKQILMDKEARKSLEIDVEEFAKSLDEMNQNALTLLGELEMANSRISTLEDEKQLLYNSLAEQKNASKEAQENVENAQNMVLRLGKERGSSDKKAKKLEEELASAKGEILRLRSRINPLKAIANDQQHLQKGESEDNNKVTVNAKRSTRRKRASSQ